jgi:hypothetical protein
MKRMNRALLATAEGDWAGATENFSAILEKDSDNFGVRLLFGIFLPLISHPLQALNNLAVTLLNRGKAKEVIYTVPCFQNRSLSANLSGNRTTRERTSSFALYCCCS